MSNSVFKDWLLNQCFVIITQTKDIFLYDDYRWHSTYIVGDCIHNNCDCLLFCGKEGFLQVAVRYDLFLRWNLYGWNIVFASYTLWKVFGLCKLFSTNVPSMQFQFCVASTLPYQKEWTGKAISTFVTYTSDVEGSMWYSIVTINFWVDHLMVVLVCLMMVSAGWFKPRKEYVFKVCLCLLAYFGACFFANFAFNGWSISGPHNHSYTMSSGSIMILEPLYKLIPIPFVYLLPLFPIFMGLFYLLAFFFKKYTLPHNPYSDANIFPKQIKASQFPQNNQ